VIGAALTRRQGGPVRPRSAVAVHGSMRLLRQAGRRVCLCTTQHCRHHALGLLRVGRTAAEQARTNAKRPIRVEKAAKENCGSQLPLDIVGG
jgi:hypothetical protein